MFYAAFYYRLHSVVSHTALLFKHLLKTFKTYIKLLLALIPLQQSCFTIIKTTKQQTNSPVCPVIKKSGFVFLINRLR